MELGLTSEQRRDLLAKSVALQNEIPKFSEPDSGEAGCLALSIRLATFYKCISELLQSCAIEEPLRSLLQSSMDSLSCFVNPSRTTQEELQKSQTLHGKMEAIRRSISTDIIPLLGGSLSLEDEPVNLCHPEEPMVEQAAVYARNANLFKGWKGVVGSFLVSDAGGLLIKVLRGLKPAIKVAAATMAIVLAFQYQQRFLLDCKRKELKDFISTANDLRQHVAIIKAIKTLSPERAASFPDKEGSLVLWYVFRSLHAIKQNEKLLKELKNKDVELALKNIMDVLCDSNTPLRLDPKDILHIQYGPLNHYFTGFLKDVWNDQALEAIHKKYMPKYHKYVTHGGDKETKTLDLLSNNFETILRVIDPQRRGWQPTDIWGRNAMYQEQLKELKAQTKVQTKVQAIATMSTGRPKYLPNYARTIPVNPAVPLASKGVSWSLAAKVFC